MPVIGLPTRVLRFFLGEEMTTAEAPACLCRQLSFPSRSISNPWTSCLIVAIRYPFAVSPETNLSIRNVFPLSDLPTIDTIGIMETLQDSGIHSRNGSRWQAGMGTDP